MLVAVEKLRWLGIDMRPRWRRRVAVVVTYAAFVVAVWWHPPRTYEVVMALWCVWIFGIFWSLLLKDALSIWAQRVVVGLLLLGAGWFIWHGRALAGNVAIVGMYAMWLLILQSVLSFGRLVDMSGRGWLAQQIAKGEPMNWWRRRALARAGFAIGLDGFAWYKHGVKFKRLAAEQKVEIGQMQQEYPRGRWMRKKTLVLFDDERMRHEDDRVRAKVQRVMSGVLVGSAFGRYWAAESDWRVSREAVAIWAWTLAALALTLRQAIVLWAEDDPREVVGEMELVEREA